MNDTNSHRSVRRVLGTCAIILTLAMSAIALLQSYTAQAVVARRSVTVDALNAYGKRQECFNSLVAEFDVSVAELAATEAGTDARRLARERFLAAGNRLHEFRAMCVEPNPLPQDG